jgi:DNA replication protein DnaC
MEPIRNIFPSVLGKIGNDSLIGDLVWECVYGDTGEYQGVKFTRQGCGLIEPLQLPSGRHIRRSCACERAAKATVIEHQQHEAWSSQQISATYGWLGSRWYDTSLASKTFGNFDCERQPKAYDATQLFLSLMTGSLVLHGTFGTGKTHLLAAICNYLRRLGKASLFCTAPDLFSAIQYRISRNDDHYEVIDKAIRTPLFVIDDIDKAKQSEFRGEVYFEIIDRRTRQGKPIAISTNRLDELDAFMGGACVSRLSMGLIEIEMSGDDFRKQL